MFYRWEKTTSVLTGLVRLGEKAATKPVGPGFEEKKLNTILVLVLINTIL